MTTNKRPRFNSIASNQKKKKEVIYNDDDDEIQEIVPENKTVKKTGKNEMFIKKSKFIFFVL